MSCAETFAGYALRSLGIGERLLPRTDFTLCEQVVLIGSGMIWNVYFAVFALAFGFFAATAVAVARASERWWLREPARAFIFVLRGSPLFIQFFIAYETFVLIPKAGIDINLGFIEITAETRWLTKAWLGALIVLFLNTTAYTAQIFHGALMSVPKGDLEAADSIGMPPFRRFRRIVFPSMLRLAWASYTNEAIFLFHATSLVFFSSFPAWRQAGDALYYANYFADKTFNPFIPYPIIAGYFIAFTLLLTICFGFVNRHLNRHLRESR
ncbi:MAG: ABC transporter permease subunit [Rhodobacteraceae bacterium]|nr:ABC transporter permease subunit [Paracoccaceae bacterium]